MRRLSKTPLNRGQAAALTAKPGTEVSEVSTFSGNPVSQYLAEIGRKGGIKGGKARKEALSPRRRKEIAKKAAEARWSAEKGGTKK